MEHAEVVRRMILFDKGDARRIQHFLKVYMFSAVIGKMENLSPEQQEILEIAAILHDIGIHPAEKIRFQQWKAAGTGRTCLRAGIAGRGRRVCAGTD